MAEVQAALPPGVTLAPGEQPLARGSFMFSNVLFFLHWQMAMTNRRLVGQTPNTILGVIPMGSTQVSYPMAAIAGVTVRTRYSVFWLLVGLVLLLAGIQGRNVLAIILGILALGAAFRAEISVVNSGGQRTGHGVSFFDRSAASAFAQQVSTAIATHGNQGQVIAQPAIVPAVGTSAGDALAELGRLRDAGHVTAEEYDAKRKEIISRL